MQKIECEVDFLRNAGEDPRRKPRIYGDNIVKSAKRYGLAADKILDFSANVNPLGPSSLAKRAAKKSLAFIDHYPDSDMIGIRRAIARYFGIKYQQVTCGNGSNSLIHFLPRVFKPKKVLIPVPTYSEYAVAAEDAGSAIVSFHLRERDGYHVDPIELSFALKGVDMAFLCNPNNPTGQIIPKKEMMEIISYALPQRVTLVVDEAFMDFVDSESIAKEAVQSSRIICIRSFTQFFGMPGLRIGYAISDEATIADLQNAQEPWTVNIPAQEAAIAALDDWGHIKKTHRLIEKERNRLLSALRLLPGVEPFPGTANFIFLKFDMIDAHTLIEKLGCRGIMVHDCSCFQGLDSRYIRIAVRTRRENNRLIRSLRELIIR